MSVKFGPKTEEAMRADVLAQRRAEYDAHVGKMTISDDVHQWVAWMTTRWNGPTVKVWGNEVPLVQALLIIRYGEAVVSNCVPGKEGEPTRYWPFQFSEKDIQRAVEWTQGDNPGSVEYVS